MGDSHVLIPASAIREQSNAQTSESTAQQALDEAREQLRLRRYVNEPHPTNRPMMDRDARRMNHRLRVTSQRAAVYGNHANDQPAAERIASVPASAPASVPTAAIPQEPNVNQDAEILAVPMMIRQQLVRETMLHREREIAMYAIRDMFEQQLGEFVLEQEMARQRMAQDLHDKRAEEKKHAGIDAEDHDVLKAANDAFMAAMNKEEEQTE